MKKVLKAILEIILLGFACWLLFITLRVRIETPAEKLPKPTPTPEVTVTAEPAETSAPVEAAPEATPEPTATPEPAPEVYTLSAVGDCTLWSNANYEYHPAGYAGMMGDDYSYPFANTVQYFANDELTLANLECILTDKKLTVDYTASTFAFQAPTAYANILIEGGVDFVTTANNHLMDCYEAGRDSTYAALNEYGIPFGAENDSNIITTKSGLRVGIYTAGTTMRPDAKTDSVLAAIQQMRADGAELVVCMFHWGNEMHYSQFDYQTELAHKCIDAGADIIYGSHSHCLQRVEEYNGGFIMYSLGNWSFGGSTMPKDPDTAIIQVILTRGDDGNLKYSGYDCIPCCVSSNIDGAANNVQNYNDYKPTPYEADNPHYLRVMGIVTGEIEPDSYDPDYSNYYASRG